jgi:hypothetical protein
MTQKWVRWGRIAETAAREVRLRLRLSGGRLSGAWAGSMVGDGRARTVADDFSYGYLADVRSAALAAVVGEADDARATRSLLRRWPRRHASPPPFVRAPGRTPGSECVRPQQ